MKLALSTNWCNRRLASGREIAELAKALGFDALELGFHTTDQQARELVDAAILPIGSVHAFCPVPISAPCGYPELYSLADRDAETRAMARFQIVKNIRFAASVGASALVLHAGRVYCDCWFKRNRLKKRLKRGLEMVEIFKRELATIVPELEQHHIVLGLENLPYLEGFPNETEIREVTGDWVRPWLDIGHEYVRRTNHMSTASLESPIGLHVNDSNGGDDHLPPGEGKVDFAAYREVARQAKCVVFEPNESVDETRLMAGLQLIRQLWQGAGE